MHYTDFSLFCTREQTCSNTDSAIHHDSFEYNQHIRHISWNIQQNNKTLFMLIRQNKDDNDNDNDYDDVQELSVLVCYLNFFPLC